MKHGSCFSHYVFVLPFSHPIFLWVMGCYEFSSNTLVCAKFLEDVRKNLSSIVTSQGFQFLISILFYQYFEFKKIGKHSIHFPHDENPKFSRKFINKNYIIPMLCFRGCRKWSIYIRVESLQDFSSCSISALEGGFDIIL